MGRNDATTMAFLICRIDTRLCALPLAHVAETMRPLPVEAIANMPPYLLGVSVIRGAMVPVLNLPLLVGAFTASKPGRFVTLKLGQRQVCLAVHAVIGVRELGLSTAHDIPPLLRHADAAAISAIGILDAELLLVLQAAHLVSDAVWQALEQERETA